MKRLSTVYIGMLFVVLASADEPPSELAKKPQWQRMLTGEDLKKAKELEFKVRLSEGIGNRAEAVKTAEELLAFRKVKQGEDHWQVTDVRVRLTDLRKDRTAEQMAQVQQAVRFNNDAFALTRRGRYSEAQPLYQKALDLFSKILGEEHPDTIISINNLALNLTNQGKTTEAQPLHEKALILSRKILGEDYPDTATSFNNLALNFKDQGKVTEAEPHYRKALDICRRVLGDDHPDTASSYYEVASNLQGQGKIFEAQPLYQNALDIRRKVLNENDPDTAHSYNGVAVNLQAQGKIVEAQSHFQKALDIRRKILGEKHPDTAISYSNLAYILQAQGNAAAAQPFLQNTLDTNRKVLGEDHPQTAQGYINLAINSDALGNAPEAQSLHQKALNIRRRALRDDHPDMAISFIYLAFNLQAQGKAVEAAAVLRQAIFSYEASRLNRAKGIERAIGERFNPRLLLAAIEQQQSPAAAWANVEMTLARGLLDQQGQATSNLTPTEAADLARWQTSVTDLQSQILVLVTNTKRTADETTRLEQLLADRRETEKKLATLAVAASTREVATSEAIQTAIPADAALLLWVDVESRSGTMQEHFACVVRGTGDLRWERLPGSGPNGKWTKDDSELSQKLLEALARSASAAEIDTLAKRVHAQRIAPILKHLNGVKRLYVVPVEQMAGVPIEVLISDFTVNYVPSGTFLARLKDRPRSGSDAILAVGDPVYPSAPRFLEPAPLPPGGLLVTQVVPGGAAATARIQVGDVLLKYGNKTLTTIDDLKTASAAQTEAKSVEITLWRDGKTTVRDMAPGRLGVILDPQPAPEAIATKRKTDAQLAKLSRGGDWVELPGTAAEVARLRELFGDKVTTLTQSDASEQRLEALRASGELAKYRYLHFATHGEGNAVKAFESALILARDKLPKELPRSGEKYYDGRLSAREVLDDWKLDAELVTLSACETAVGKPGGGDGLLGFAQAFLTAGSRSVCLSLWKVDDAATALLMDRFYRNLLGKREGLDKPMGKAAALAEAKHWLRELSEEQAIATLATVTKGVARGAGGTPLKLVVPERSAGDPSNANGRRPFAHPRYWSAFILLGDPN